jgi:hypothetical protein
MNAYLVIVLLLVPPSQGSQPIEAELHREVIAASSLAVCERHAERLAREQREKHAELLARTRGRAVGHCQPLRTEPSA